MDFSIPQLFVLQPGNTLPTSGSTQNLAPGQAGVFLPSYVPATNGNVAGAKWVQIFQGRLEEVPNLKSKRSDKIKVSHIQEFYKVVAEDTARVQITDITGIEVHCGETISITTRLFSKYINASYDNGLTRSWTLSAPCCDCDADPCALITGTDLQNLVDDWVAQINATNPVNRFLVASRIGTGTGSGIRLSGIPLTQYGSTCDLFNFPYTFDLMRFNAWVYRGAPGTWDAPMYVNYDNCEIAGTVTTTQTATYPRGSSEQVAQVEKNTWSYQASYPGKDLFSNPNFNGSFTSYVTPGTFYDLYVIKFINPEGTQTFGDYETQDSTVQLFVPTGQGAAIETLLETFTSYPFTDESGVNISTTSTSSTSSTTSTTTTN